MAHVHYVIDDDPHFKIDADTRLITCMSEKEPTLIQGDHNSERFTFEIPKTIDGHDVELCDEIRVHFINIASGTTDTSPGIYYVDDLQASEDDPDTMLFSWLIAKEATVHVGTLSFIIELVCKTGNIIDYSWHTAVYTGGVIAEGMDNSELIFGKYYDTLDQWVALIAQAGTDARTEALNRINDAATAASNNAMVRINNHAETVRKDLTRELVSGMAANDILVQTTGQNTDKVISQKVVTDEINRLDSEIANAIAEAQSGNLEFQTDIENRIASLGRYTKLTPDANGKYALTPNVTYLVESKKTEISWGFKLGCSVWVERNVNVQTIDGPGVKENEPRTLSIDDAMISPNTYPLNKYLTGFNTIRVLSVINVEAVDIDSSTGYKAGAKVSGVYLENGAEREWDAKVEDTTRVEQASYTTSPATLKYVITGATNVYEVSDDPTGDSVFTVNANGIASVTKTATSGLTNTYTITFDNGTTTTFEVKDGVGVSGVDVSYGEYEDTYTMRFTDGTTTNFKIPNNNTVGIRTSDSGAMIHAEDLIPLEHAIKASVRSKNLIKYPYTDTLLKQIDDVVLNGNTKNSIVWEGEISGDATLSFKWEGETSKPSSALFEIELVDGSIKYMALNSQSALFANIKRITCLNWCELTGRVYDIRLDRVQKVTAGITFTSNVDGSVSAVGTVEDNTFAALRLSTNLKLESGRTYYVSQSRNLILAYKDETGATKYLTDGTVTWEDGYEFLQVYIQYSPKTTVDETVYPMLCESDVPVDYVPYVDVSEVTLTRCGKNLLPPVAFEEATESGLTFTKNSDGSITVNGTATALVARVIVPEFVFAAGVQYTLSGCPSGGGTDKWRLDNTDKMADDGAGCTATYSVDTVTPIRLRIASGATLDNLTFKPQLEVGDKATDYEPYVGEEYAIGTDGTPIGRVTSLTPTMNLLTDKENVIIDATYNVDWTEAITGNTDRISILETESEELSQRITENTERITALETKSEELSQRITGNTDRITALETESEELSQGIEENSTHIDTLETESNKTHNEIFREISAHSKRLINIEQKLSGDDFVTDDTSAYIKPVPDDILPYAEIQKVGGMSYKCTNLFDFDLSKFGGKLEVTQSVTVALTKPLPIGTYTMGCVCTSTDTVGTYNSVSFVGGGSSDGTTNINIAVQRDSRITKTVTLLHPVSQIRFNASDSYDSSAGYTATFTDIMINEGSTALPYEPYFSGFRNAAVSKLKSIGVNYLGGEALANAIKTAIPGAVIDTVNKTISFKAYDSPSRWRFTDLKPNTAYTLVFYGRNTSSSSTASNLIYKYTDAKTAVHTFFSSAEDSYLVLNTSGTRTLQYVGGGNYAGETLLYYDKCGIFEGSLDLTVVDGELAGEGFEEYVEENFAIPEAIRTKAEIVDNYGVGINESVCNHIDFVEKKFVKMVGCVDMGTLNWARNPERASFYATSNAWKRGAALLCVPYRKVSSSEFRDSDKVISAYYSQHPQALNVRDSAYTDAEAFKSAMSGVMLYYELATPEITDISDLLTTDNYIGVFGGGNIIAINEHALAAPTTIEYQKEGTV